MHLSYSILPIVGLAAWAVSCFLMDVLMVY